MNFLKDNMVPYVGTDTFKLGDSLERVRDYLKENKVNFSQSIDLNKGCVPEVPWIFIEISDSITLCFVKDVLFEIVFENNYMGQLPNGGLIGMKMVELEVLDPTLEYNDDDEDFISQSGYWVVDDIETGRVTSITIFLPEVELDTFFRYEWVEKYKK